MRLFIAGLRKLVRRPATYVLFVFLLAIMTLLFLALGATAKQTLARPGGAAALRVLTFPDAYGFVLSFILGLGGLLAVMYGAATAGSEWTWGTIKAAVARGESRTGYILSTFASLALLVGVGLLFAFTAGVILAVIGAGLASISTSGMSDSTALGNLPEQLLRSWIGVAEEAALGFAIATIAKSQLAGVVSGIALYFGESFATIFFPDVVKYLPFSVASAAVGASTGTTPGGGAGAPTLDPNAALIAVIAWMIGALVVASLFTERAEIGG